MTVEMASPLGYGTTPKGEAWLEFVSLCKASYLVLRRRAPLILASIGLLRDAAIGDLAADPDAGLRLVERRFGLEMTDPEAETHVEKLVAESMSALAPAVLEIAHKMAVRLR